MNEQTPNPRTVRDAAVDVMRNLGLTTIFANPGSTEIPFLTGLPDDMTFHLALHEGSVVGMATGYALTRNRPALVNVHTTAGLGNAVGAIATARVNRAPLVVIVGQQDRRHLVNEPFLSGKIEGLAGDYPVWTDQPIRAQDVPGAIARAFHEATAARGPAIVIVPMNDWDEIADEKRHAAPHRVIRPTADTTEAVRELSEWLGAARSPVIVAGAGNDTPAGWDALARLAGKLGAPVWQEAFGARAGFPQNNPAFAGHLPTGRSALRDVLADHDLLLVVGAPALRQYAYEPGELIPAGMTVAQVTAIADEAHMSIADLAIVTEPALICERLADVIEQREHVQASRPVVEPVPAPAGDEPMYPAHVFDLMSRHLPPNTILIEESPSSRPELHRRLPARDNLGFLSAAGGGLGFGVPATVGAKLGAADRPVVAVLGDGSTLYGIHGLWSAVHYNVGALFVVMANGGYAVMDRLAEHADRGKAPWPSFTEVRVSTIAQGLGCDAERITSYEQLVDRLEAVLPTLADRTTPLLFDIDVAADPTYG